MLDPVSPDDRGSLSLTVTSDDGGGSGLTSDDTGGPGGRSHQ